MVSFLRLRFPALALAAALLALGIPQAANSLLHLYAESAPETRDSPEGPLLADFPADVAMLETIDRWFNDPAARIRAGISRFYSAAPGDSAVSQEELLRAVDDLSAGLARAPANAVAWTILGHAALTLGNEADARRALRTSILLAPYNPALSMARLDLGLRLWPTLDDYDRGLLSDQMMSGWKDRPEELVKFAKHGGYQHIVMTALARDPLQLTKFLIIFARQR